jgi:hypothetical protein
MRTLYHRSGATFWLIISLVLLNAALYALFTLADLRAFGHPAREIPTDLLKYASLCACFVISLIALRDAPGRRDARLQVVIFAFTLAADFLILFTPRLTAGIAVFCGAHATAAIRYGGARRAARAVVVAAVAAAALAIFASLAPHDPYPPGGWLGEGPRYDETGAAPSGHHDAEDGMTSARGLYAELAAIAAYATLISASTIFAFMRRQPRTNAILSRLGMSLFILCDLNVLLWNLREGAVLPGVPAWTGILMWTFYLPGQTALALSAMDVEDAGGPA